MMPNFPQCQNPSKEFIVDWKHMESGCLIYASICEKEKMPKNQKKSLTESKRHGKQHT
jgi:hypothetical protein